MITRYDVIVVGVGTMGASACYHLAGRDVRVLGIERFGIPHDRGAHHGHSRAIRKAYFEHPDYVPLIERAYENWARLEADSGRKLIHHVGGLYLGPADSEAIAGSLKVMKRHVLPYELLDVEQVRKRYPMFRPRDDFVGLVEPSAGFILPESAVATLAEQALRRGAQLHGHERVRRWSADNGSAVTVETDRDAYECDRVIFCGGAWTTMLMANQSQHQWQPPVRVTRQITAWVWPRKPDLFTLGTFPIWLIDIGQGGIHYGIPMTPDRPGFKVALHLPASPTDPDAVAREPMPGDEDTFRPILRRFIPDADGPLLSMGVCMYANSPDGHFIIDKHPIHDRVIVACGFSGHGFKFASVVGEALADMATAGKTELPIGFLGLSRFGAS